MHEFNDELDGPAIALLELYRDAGAPPPEVEDRLLARIEAQAAIEADLESDDRELLGAEPQPTIESGVRPLTAVLIAIVAFAAGVALTVGLRAQMAQLVEDPFAPSVAPMTAEDQPAHEIAEPRMEEACGAIVIEEPVEESELDESEEADAERDGAEEDDEPSARSFVAPSEDEEPVEVSEGQGIDEEPSVREYGVTLSPWSGARDGEDTRRSSSTRGSRSTRSGGYWAPMSIGSSSSSSSSSSSRPSMNGGARGPSTPKPSGGNGNPGNGKPGGDNGGGDRPAPPKPDPGTPPPPTSNPGNDDPPPPGDDRPPEEPPPPDEPEPAPDWDQCAYDHDTCNTQAQDACVYDPDYCDEYLYGCDLTFEMCAYPDEMAQCDQGYIDCIYEADTICLQDPAMQDPELPEECTQLYDLCNNDYLACMGYGDDEPDPTQGVE